MFPLLWGILRNLEGWGFPLYFHRVENLTYGQCAKELREETGTSNTKDKSESDDKSQEDNDTNDGIGNEITTGTAIEVEM